MDIDNLVCNLGEVTAAFDAAVVASNLSDAQIADEVGCDQSTIGRIRKGQREPGAILFARALVIVGKTPNEVLLRRPGQPRMFDDAFDADEHADFARIVETFKSIKRKNNGPVSPVKMFTEALIAVDETIPAPAAVVQVHADGVKTIEPMPTTAITRKGDTGKSDRLKAVSEDAPDYPAKNE